jgi:AcrR family transcriptional regulator
MSADAVGRVWGGLTAQQRLDRRREQFLAAGLEVFGAHGWAGTTVLQVCREAKLSQRYFYEQFVGREALFLAVMDRIAADVEDIVRRAATTEGRSPLERADGVLRALTAFFAGDPRTVRVSLIESFATHEFRVRRAALLASFSALGSRLMLALTPHPACVDRRELELSALVLSGGIAEMLVGAQSGQPPPEPDELVRHLTRLYATAAAGLASTGRTPLASAVAIGRPAPPEH